MNISVQYRRTPLAIPNVSGKKPPRKELHSREKKFKKSILSEPGAEQGDRMRQRSKGAALFDSFSRASRRSTDLSSAFEVQGKSSTDDMRVTGSLQIRRRGSNSEPSPFLKEVPLDKVTLVPDSVQGIAQETNLRYLLMLDIDRLVWSFRVTADLPAPRSPYGGWAHPSMELRGHFVGHYLSATALTWASTHNASLLEKMTQAVDALEECQDRLGTGYLSAFPAEFFDRFEEIRPVWAPYYTIHKIMAGLLDQYTLAGNEKALGMLLWMAEYFLGRVETVIHKYTIERHWESLNEEVGGMNDILYRLFMLTGDPDHLKLAHLFDKPCFLGLLALQTDGLAGFHANTHIPLVVGSQMRYEATGDELYAEISHYFMHIINTSHRYATGGTSVSEFWYNPNRNVDALLTTENQETCTTYNMLKVARNMYRWTKDISYADYYERALVNGILGIQRGKEPGVMIYMLPQGPGTSKAVSYHGWGTPYDAFWCCYGTAVESFSKLGDSIYFEEDNGNTSTLQVAQYVSSNLTWDAAGLLLSQGVQPLSSNDPFLHVTFGFYDLAGSGSGKEVELSLRIPSWTIGATSEVWLNGFSMGTPKAGSYFKIMRAWNAGDVLQVDLHVSLHLEKVQDDRAQFSSLYAILFGPYLLAGMSDGDFQIEAVNASLLSSWIVPVPASLSAQLVTFSQAALGLGGQTAVLSYGGTSAVMRPVPPGGTNDAAQATFLLTSYSLGTGGDSLIGRLVSFELYSQPGNFLAHSGVNGNLLAVDEETRQQSRNASEDSGKGTPQIHQNLEAASSAGASLYRVLPGLSGDMNTVSFEIPIMEGCFLVSDEDNSIIVDCLSKSGERDPNFYKRASFTVNKGLSAYNPMSFFARGKNKQFLLFPIYAYLDETYATYFNLTSA